MKIMKLIKLYALIVLISTPFAVHGGWFKKTLQEAIKTKTDKVSTTKIPELAPIPAPKPLALEPLKLPAIEEFKETYQSEGVLNPKSPKALAKSSEEAEAQQEGVLTTVYRQLRTLENLLYAIDQALEKIQNDFRALLKKKLISKKQRDVQLSQLSSQASVLQQRKAQLEGRDMPIAQLTILHQQTMPAFPTVPLEENARLDQKNLVAAQKSIGAIVSELKRRGPLLQYILEDTKSYLAELEKDAQVSSSGVAKTQQELTSIAAEKEQVNQIIQEAQAESDFVAQRLREAVARQKQIQAVANRVQAIKENPITVSKSEPKPAESGVPKEAAVVFNPAVIDAQVAALEELEKELAEDKEERAQQEQELSSLTDEAKGLAQGDAFAKSLAANITIVEKMLADFYTRLDSFEDEVKTITQELQAHKKDIPILESQIKELEPRAAAGDKQDQITLQSLQVQLEDLIGAKAITNALVSFAQPERDKILQPLLAFLEPLVPRFKLYQTIYQDIGSAVKTGNIKQINDIQAFLTQRSKLFEAEEQKLSTQIEELKSLYSTNQKTARAQYGQLKVGLMLSLIDEMEKALVIVSNEKKVIDSLNEYAGEQREHAVPAQPQPGETIKEKVSVPAVTSSVGTAIDQLYTGAIAAQTTVAQDVKTMNEGVASVSTELIARGAPDVSLTDAAQEVAISYVQEVTASTLLEGMDQAKKPAAEKQLKNAQTKKASILKTLNTKLAPLKIWARKNWKEITGIVITVALIPIIGVTLFVALAPADQKRPARNMALLIQRLQSAGVDLSQLSYNQLQAAYDAIIAAGYTIATISDQTLLNITGFNAATSWQRPQWQTQNRVLLN
jgi:hypothetical protein